MGVVVWCGAVQCDVHFKVHKYEGFCQTLPDSQIHAFALFIAIINSGLMLGSLLSACCLQCRI